MEKRVTVKLKTPNPLFTKWITEWRDKAREEDSSTQYCFAKALKSLKQYPLPLETAKSCKMLNGFGTKLCAMLDHKLKQHKKNNGAATDIHDMDTDENENDLNLSNKTKKAKAATPKKRKHSDSTKTREYIPAIGSGAYAILLALHQRSLQVDYLGYMHKNDIMKYGQVFSDKSFTRPDPGTFYTAWSSMKTLISNNLVVKNSNPAKYSLTDEGIELASKLQEHKDNETEVFLTIFLCYVVFCNVFFRMTTSRCINVHSAAASKSLLEVL